MAPCRRAADVVAAASMMDSLVFNVQVNSIQFNFGDCNEKDKTQEKKSVVVVDVLLSCCFARTGSMHVEMKDE